MNSLEFLCEKNDCALAAFVSHSKKRPQNLVLLRMFDGHVLDMMEFGVEEIFTTEVFDDVEKFAIGAKPCFLFNGVEFAEDPTYMAFKNLFMGTCVQCVPGRDGVGRLLLMPHMVVRLRLFAPRRPVVRASCQTFSRAARWTA